MTDSKTRAIRLARDRTRDLEGQRRQARRLRSRPGVYAADQGLHADSFFTTFAATREEEAIGIISGAWMGGLRGAVLMQTSGFATIPNALASLVVPISDPGPDIRIGARHARRVQSWTGAGVQDHAAGAQLNCGRKHNHHAPGRARLHRSTAPSNRPSRRRRRSPSSFRRCSPAAKYLRREMRHDRETIRSHRRAQCQGDEPL